MKQYWKNLFFIHYAIPKDLVEEILPPNILCDSLNGKSYLGVVGFTMQKTNLAKFPYFSYPPFHELNLRTYVKLQGGKKAVYFFSLDANSRIAVFLARQVFKLNYFYSPISYSVEGNVGEMKACLDSSSISVHKFEIGEDILTDPTAEFLVERYHFITKKNNTYYTGHLRHIPYRLRRIYIRKTDLLLTNRVSISEDDLNFFEKGCYYCPGFEVEVASFSREVLPNLVSENK
jgi:uncharacterized protein YqjF (DUF2071 family)